MASLVASTGLLLWIWRVYQGHVSPWLIVDDACGRGSKLRQFPQVDSFSSLCLYLCKHHEIDTFFFARHRNQERFRNRYYFSNRSQYEFSLRQGLWHSISWVSSLTFFEQFGRCSLDVWAARSQRSMRQQLETRVFQMGFLVFDFLGGSMMKGKFLKLWSLILLMV